MSGLESKDFTRWNRAGLSRFEYIDGNAATFLEKLRKELAKEGRFRMPAETEPYWDVLKNPPTEEYKNTIGYEREELLRKRSEQLLAQYRGERGDWAWEITRSFARASHILTHYINAYANEGFIGTATQWDNVRRMVEMLDYHPSPPASASTRLVLVAKENRKGMVAKGFQIKNNPIMGGEKAIFETLEELYIDPALDELRIKGSDRSEVKLSEEMTIKWNLEDKPKVFSGQVAMLFNETGKIAKAAIIGTVDEIDNKAELSSSENPATWMKWSKGEVTLRVAPHWKRECWLKGDYVIHTVCPHGVGEGTYIGWYKYEVLDPQEGEEKVWSFAEVVEVDKWSLRLESMSPMPISGTNLYEARVVSSNVMSANFEAIGMTDLSNLTGPDAPTIEPRHAGDNVLITPENGELPPEVKPPFELPEEAYTPTNIPDKSETGFPPPGKLSFGSFLFPSPMLPVDLVKAAVELMLNIGVMVIPSTGEIVFKKIPDAVINTGAEDNQANAVKLLKVIEKIAENDPPAIIVWPGLSVNASEADKEGALEVMLDAISTAQEKSDASNTVLFQEIQPAPREGGPSVIAVQKCAPVKAIVAESDPQLYMFDGKPDKVEQGDWLVGQINNGGQTRYKALKVESITESMEGDKTERFSLNFDTSFSGYLKKVYADFRGELTAKGAEVNVTSVVSGELEVLPESLKIGQYVLLTAEGKDAVLAKIEDITNYKTIVTKPSIASFGFTKGELIIHGNVVLCGHGETRPEKVLGSGDAAQSNQSFVFSVEGVSFIADETMNAGVAADIDIIVDGQIWEQVSSLNDSEPTDIHYSVYMTEEGFLKINFGDGEHGRRLPSGSNNVRITYRKGSGLVGNIPAGGLENVVKPDRLVESVLQPMDATGGNDMENITSLRENAPASLLTLDRAVSLADFENLAASDSRVWQAKAYSRASVLNRHENVEVVIVPAGGGELGDLASDIKKSLQSKALPGVIVTVSKYIEIPFILDVIIKVKEDEYNPEMVVEDVKSALLDTFSLSRSRLGEHLYLSRVYQVVENVEGVERSICKIDGNSDLRVKKAASDHLIYLAEDVPPKVESEAYEL